MKQCSTCKQKSEAAKRKAEYDRNYYQRKKNTEEYKQKAEEYRERKLELCRIWRENNKEHIKEYAEKNKERKAETNRLLRAQRREYYLQHEQEITEKYPTKVCSKCKRELSREYFYKDLGNIDGLSYICKDCSYEYYKNNREAIQKKNKDRYDSEKAMKYYYQNGISSIMNERNKQRRKTDVKFAIDHRMQNLLNPILKLRTKTSSTLLERCGYTVGQLLSHMESQFTQGMSWDNYGNYWECDHIQPKYVFNYESYDDEQFKQCWALSNLRPLLIKDNQTRNKS